MPSRPSPADRIALVAVGVVALVAVSVAWARWDRHVETRGETLGHATETLPTLERPEEGFVTSDTCRSCHPGKWRSWHDTFHRTMTRVATPETVRADFDGVTLELFGHEIALERTGDEFWAEMVDPDFELKLSRRGRSLADFPEAPRTRERIVMITGSHHMQVFWVRRDDGTLFLFPFAWLLEEGGFGEARWVPVEDTLLKPPQGHRDIPTWNKSCSFCHTAAPDPGAHAGSESLETAVAELGIPCEACHGPAREHLAKQASPVARWVARSDDEGDPTILDPADIPAVRASQVCGQCHSIAPPKEFGDWLRHGTSYRAGGELDASRDLILPASRPGSPRLRAEMARDREFLRRQFWADGEVRVSGREYTAMVESKCFAGGELSCLSCHSMHDSNPVDQLAAGMDGDASCFQCHGDLRSTIAEHTRHPVGSSGASCLECHMPYTTYGLLKAIRSHRISSPTVATTVATGRPNACNQCHLDRPLGWTNRYLAEWYGQPRVELPREREEIAASVLHLLLGDAGQRALAAWTMGRPEARAASGDGWQAPYLARTLDDPYATVRFIAGRSLASLPGWEGLDYDYVAGTGELAAARRAATERAEPGTGRRPETGLPSLLLAADGTLDLAEIERLLAFRDNRPLTLQE